MSTTNFKSTMRFTPKKTKYHYTFRNKLQNQKVAQADIRALFAFGKNHAMLNQIFKVNAWCQTYDSTLHCTIGSNPYVYDNDIHLCNGRYLNHAYTGSLLFGNFGIAFETHGKLTSKFVKTVHLDIAKTLKKKSKVWLRLCCDTPVTARPVETRMGKGKGAISYWEAKVSPGQMLFEFSGITKHGVMGILKSLQQKSPLRLRLVIA
jgi:large subunit ribosomal protein L16